MVKAINVFINNLSWSIEQGQNTILFPQNFRLEAGKILCLAFKKELTKFILIFTLLNL